MYTSNTPATRRTRCLSVIIANRSPSSPYSITTYNQSPSSTSLSIAMILRWLEARRCRADLATLEMPLARVETVSLQRLDSAVDRLVGVHGIDAEVHHAVCAGSDDGHQLDTARVDVVGCGVGGGTGTAAGRHGVGFGRTCALEMKGRQRGDTD